MNGKTLAYIVKRVLLAVVTIFVVVSLTFWFMQLIPGGPFTKEKMPFRRRRWRLWPRNMDSISRSSSNIGLCWPGFQLRLRSFACRSKYVGLDVNYRHLRWNEVFLPDGLVAAVIAIVVWALLFGSIAAVKRGWDRSCHHGLSTASVAFPSFVIATILLYFFAFNGTSPRPITSMAAPAFILPVITLALSDRYITRLARSATLDSLGSDYIITARAKGASKSRILFGHVMKNSLAPTITYAGPMFASIITGSLVIEQIYQVPGIGKAFIQIDHRP
jgi:oligopeptide transport system permease protein